MKKTNIIMGMPITVEVVGDNTQKFINNTFKYFIEVDERFSTYKSTSEISQVNRGLPKKDWSQDMIAVLDLCESTKKLTKGYFDIKHKNKLDPSGLVKGWAINKAASRLTHSGVENFYIEAGGDIQAQGTSANNDPWLIGLRSPFNINEIIKVVILTNQGIATSGTYVRGQHIYNPHDPDQNLDYIKSLTVIAPNVYEADRFATAAYAMGKAGISFIEETPELEGYMVGSDRVATYTSGFERYVVLNA